MCLNIESLSEPFESASGFCFCLWCAKFAPHGKFVHIRV